jgi:hypothetical protein
MRVPTALSIVLSPNVYQSRPQPLDLVGGFIQKPTQHNSRFALILTFAFAVRP